MAVKTGGGFQNVLLSSENAGGTSSDLQHHLGCSFPGVTSLLCHLLGDPCALCIPTARAEISMGIVWGDLGWVLGWWQEQCSGDGSWAGSPWEGWQEQLWCCRSRLHLCCAIRDKAFASLPVAKPSSAIGV